VPPEAVVGMAIKKVTVKFDSCRDCPVMMYSGCEYAVDCGLSASCPLGDSTMMNRYTDIRVSRGDVENVLQD
jgi:hypothetical protein